MKVKQVIQEEGKIWKEFFRAWESLRAESLIENYKQTRQHDFSVLEKNGMAVFIIDYSTFGYEYVSQNCAEIVGGFSPSFFYESGLKCFEKVIHPDFIPHVVLGAEKMSEIVKQCTPEELSQLRADMIFKICTQNGDLQWVRQQSHYIAFSERNTPLLELAVITDCTLLKKDNSAYFRICSANKTHFINPCRELQSDIKLSKRETEVLGLIEKGKSSKQIADVLSISQHTVNNHRKNLMTRFKTKNIFEVIAFLKEKGIY